MKRASVLMCALLLPEVASASGFYSLDAGIKAIGRGGAFTAGADDLTAQYYNAAALSNITGTEIMLDLAAVNQAVTFDRRDEAEFSFESVKNQALPFVVPSFAFGHRFGERLVGAFGLYTPYAPTYSYDPYGAQRYSLIDATLIQTNLGPSVSYQVRDWVSVGGGVGWTLLSVEQSLKSSMNFDPSNDPLYDALFDISVMDKFAISYNAGILITPNDHLALGVSYAAPVTYNATGSMSGDFSENAFYTGENNTDKTIAVDSVADESVALSVTMPAVLKTGVLVRPTAALEIEVDFVWQGWSSVESFTITEMELVVPTNEKQDIVVTDDVGLPANMQDAWSVRLGGEYDLSEKLALRLGGFYETSAVPESTRSVFLPDANKFGYGIGATFVTAGGRLALDFGLLQAFAPSSEIASSLAFQVRVDTLTNAIESGTTVGNGDFGFTTTIAGLGATWRF